MRLEKYIANKIFFFILIGFVFSFAIDLEQAQAVSKHKSRRHSHIHIVKKHRPTKEEIQAAKEAAAREAYAAQLVEGKNLVLARAYKLYDSGTSESLQGNYKYSILQLKLADELLQEHATNSSLALVNLMALASCAQAGKDYSSARSAYGRLLAMRPQDAQLLLGLARMEASLSNFDTAQNYIDRLLNSNPDNAEGRLLANFVADKLKTSKN